MLAIVLVIKYGIVHFVESFRVGDSRWVSCEPPANGEQLLQRLVLCQLSFGAGNQIFPLFVHLILSVEKRTSSLAALCFQSFDLFLSRQLFFQRQRDNSSTACFLI